MSTNTQQDGNWSKKIITLLPNLLLLRTAYQDGSCRRYLDPQKKIFLIAADIRMIFAPFNSNTDQAFIDLGLLKVSEVIKTNQLKVEYKQARNRMGSLAKENIRNPIFRYSVLKHRCSSMNI